MPIDLEKSRREQARWYILLTLNSARPIGANEDVILNAIAGIPLRLTPLELRRELDYLAERGLLKIEGRETPTWSAQLTREGVDVAEYTVEVEPGIARPRKYWG